MSSTTVVLGFAEALAAPEVLWSLVDEGFQTIAFARKGRPCPLRHSRHVTIHEICAPEADLMQALSDLEALLKTVGGASSTKHVLFPLDDVAVWMCSRVATNDEWILAGPSGELAELALDKSLQVRTALGAGFDVPETTLARTREDVLRFCDPALLPVILKSANCVPIAQNRVRKCPTWICATPEEVQNAAEEWAERVPILVQPFLSGTGEGVFGVAARDGVRAWSAHRRLRMMNPQGSGSSACVSQPVPQDLAPKVTRLLCRAGWQGLFMIELLRDTKTGKAWFVELNGRPWGSMALSRRQGLEYPAWHVGLAIDPSSEVGLGIRTSSKVVCRNVGREIMYLLFVLKGPRSKAQRNWPSFWKSLGQVLHVGRRDTFYNWRREDPKVFFADCFHTVQSNIFKSRN